MLPNYTKFRTPFFEIYIGDSRGKEMIKLPHHLVRLVEKLEIQEVLENRHNLVTITFAEGSREPASQDPNATVGALYPLDKDIAGTLTNRTGILTDLTFGGNGKITFFTKAEQTSGKNSVNTKKNSKAINKKRAKEAAARPRFLFQEHNRLKVVWGYLEDPLTQRTVITNIKIIQTEFLDSSSTITIITGEAPMSTWSQLAPSKGVSFFKTTKVKNGKEFEDVPIKEFVEGFCKKMGLESIVSDSFVIDKLDKGKVKQIPGGMSLKQFFDKLAKQYNAYWNVIINPTTGKETLYFVNKVDVEKSLIHSEEDAVLFSYKNPQSIIRSVKVKVDFGGVTETASQNQKTGKTPTGKTNPVLFSPDKNQKPVNNKSPTTSGENAKNILGEGNVTGKSVSTPVEATPKSAETIQKMREEDARRRLVALTLETMGYARIIPGMVKISGIGLRYSGKYRIISVKHVIDSAGYFTTAECTSQFLGAGGVQPVPEQKKPVAQKTKVVSFEDKTGKTKPQTEQKRQEAMGVSSWRIPMALKK